MKSLYRFFAAVAAFSLVSVLAAQEQRGGKTLKLSGFEESEGIWLGYDQLSERTLRPGESPPEGYAHNFVFTRGAPQHQPKWVKPTDAGLYGPGPAGGPKEGAQALYWNDTLKVSRLVTLGEIPRDWSGYNYLSLWVYSESANLGGAAISIYSENAEETPTQDDYWQTRIVFDFTGWKHIEIPLASMKTTRNPIGWEKIDYIKIASSGFGVSPKANTRVWFDDLKLTEQSTAEDPLAAVEVKFPLTRHPFLFGNEAYYVDIESKRQQYGWAKAAYASVKSGADALFDPAFAIPSEGGGYYHDVTGRSGSADVSSLHYAIARGAHYAGIVYKLTGERRYAEKARAILLEYADKYLKYPLRDKYGNAAKAPMANTARVLSQPMNEARWVVYLCGAMDLIWDELSYDERAKVEKDLLRPVADLLMLNNEKGHNHQSWYNAGVGVIGFLLQDAKYVKYAVYGPDYGFLYQMRASVTSDGMWYEGSGHYHFLTMEPLTMLSEAAFHSGIDLYDARTPEGRNYRNMFLFPAKYRNPDFELPLINDGKKVVVTEDERARFLEIGYARYAADPEAAALPPILRRAARANMHALLFGVGDVGEDRDAAAGPLAAEASAAPEASVNLGDNIAVLRSPNGELFYTLNGRAYTGGHSHEDKLSITGWARSLDLSPDAGSIKYEAPEHKGYFIHTVAHNAVTVDYGTQKYVEGARTVLFSGGPLAQAAWMADDRSVPGTGQQRLLLMTDWYVFDLYALKSDAPRTYHWAYRNLGDFMPPSGAAPQADTFPKAALGADNGYRYLERPASAAVSGGLDLVWDMYNGKIATVRILDEGRPTRLWTADMLQAKPIDDEIDRNRYRGVLVERAGSSDALFAAIHAPFTRPEEFRTDRLRTAADGSAGLILQTKGALVDLIAYNLSGRNPIAAAGLKTDAALALIRRSGGRITDVFCFGASYLELPEGRLEIAATGSIPVSALPLHVRVSGASVDRLSDADGAKMTVSGTGAFASIK